MIVNFLSEVCLFLVYVIFGISVLVAGPGSFTATPFVAKEFWEKRGIRGWWTYATGPMLCVALAIVLWLGVGWSRQLVYKTEVVERPVEVAWQGHILSTKEIFQYPRICLGYRELSGKKTSACWNKAPLEWLSAKTVKIMITRYRFDGAVAKESFPYDIH